MIFHILTHNPSFLPFSNSFRSTQITICQRLKRYCCNCTKTHPFSASCIPIICFTQPCDGFTPTYNIVAAVCIFCLCRNRKQADSDQYNQKNWLHCGLSITIFSKDSTPLPHDGARLPAVPSSVAAVAV